VRHTFFILINKQSSIYLSKGIIENGKVIFEAATNVKGLVSDVAVDAEGKLWVPHWGGGAVVRCIIVK